MPTPSPKPLNTHARLILSDWQALRKAMLCFSTLLRTSNTEEQQYEANIPLLNDRQISDALNGPASAFCQMLLHAYAKLSEARFEVSIREDITFADTATADSRPSPKTNSKREKLINSLKMNDIRKIQQALDPIAEQTLSQWQNACKHWAAKINQALIAEKITLSSEQSAELADLEPISEIYGRYSDLNLTPPKLKTDGSCFRDYLYLKAYLQVHDHLSKLQQPNTADAITKALKSIKTTMAQIDKEESYLVKNHEQQLQQALQSLQAL